MGKADRNSNREQQIATSITSLMLHQHQNAHTVTHCNWGKI